MSLLKAEMRLILLWLGLLGTKALSEANLQSLLHTATDLLRNNSYKELEQFLNQLNDTDKGALITREDDIGESLFYKMVCTSSPSLPSDQSKVRHRLGWLFSSFKITLNTIVFF